MQINGFDWDEGNKEKCQKHGVTREAAEWMLQGPITVLDDPYDTDIERRFRAIGKDEDGRYLFLVFCYRQRGGNTLIRPISARYMHRKEIEHYERQN